MASYDRRITLYINGQQVSNDVRSIRAEMTRLINEQARMTIGSREYIAHAAQIRNLNGILAQHRQQIAAVGSSWSFRGIADGLNRYFALITAGIASLTGVIMGFKALVKTFNDFEERVDNLSALTGLAGESLDWLAQKAKDLSTATLEGGIRVTQGAQEIVDAFTKTGSARPELLKNKEALAAVTKEAIILSSAAKTELQPAIEALTMVMNQYNVPASEARRIINSIAAGSKEGAGEIPYITTAFEKAGTIAADAGLSIETMVATIETLAPRISQPEIAGRSLKGVLLDLQTGADDTNPKIVGMSTALENLGNKNYSVTKLTKMFGTENITTAKILINNVAELRKYESAVTGTNVALEQAGINTNNNNSKLAQAKNRINLVSMELGEKLAPSMSLVTGYFGKFLAGLLAMINFFTKYGSEIMTATAAIVGYTVAVKLSTMWTERQNRSNVIALALQKIRVIWHNTERAALLLVAAAQALLTGNITRATAAMRVFNSLIKVSPIGLLAGVVTAAATALIFYSQKKKQAAEAAKKHNDILEAEKTLMEGYSAEIIKERDSLNAIVGSIMRTNENEEIRSALIKKLKEQYPAFLGFIADEKISNEQLALRLSEVNTQYSERIRLDALKSKIGAINSASTKSEERKLEIEDRLLQIERERFRIGDKKADEEIASLNLEYKQLNNTLVEYKKRQTDLTTASTKLEIGIKEFDTLPFVEKQLAGLLSARKNYVENLKNAQKSENSEGVAFYQQQLKQADEQIKLFEAKKQMLLLKPKPGIGSGSGGSGDGGGTGGRAGDSKNTKETDAEKLRKFFALDDETQKDALKIELAKLGKEGVEALAKGIEDQVADARDTNKLLTEMVSPEKDIVDAAGDYALQKYYETIEGQQTLAMAQHQAGLIGEQEFQDKMLAIQKKASDDKTDIEYEGFMAYQQLSNSAANFVGALMDMELEAAGDNEEKKKKIRKKYADAQMIVTIAQIISSTGLAIVQAFAQLGPVGGAIAAAFIGATGAVQVASAVAQRNRLKSLSEGGFTGDGGKTEPAGIVHRGEYVIPQEGVNNPHLLPFINMFEAARQNKSLARLDLRPEIQSMTRLGGFASGGYTSPSNTPLSPPIDRRVAKGDLDSEMKEINRALAEELRLLRKNGVRASINKFGNNGLSDAIDDISKFKAKVYKK